MYYNKSTKTAVIYSIYPTRQSRESQVPGTCEELCNMLPLITVSIL